ncbi:hypothetical protein [Cryptosporangium sp. NPDC048952]|uniref:hypothetical protein n=1 Tax=Cryptosporangium sp. NPDC048952 TaxID=3363961 RepID=UPI00371D96C9
MRRLLGILAAALGVAFVVAPGWIAGIGADSLDARGLADPFRTAFRAWWQRGDRALTPELEGIVDYWFRYHLAKGAIAALLLVVLVLLGLRLGRWAAALVPVGLVAIAAVMANVQGAVAPFASLFPLLSIDDLRAPAAVMRAGDRPPTLVAMIDDYTLYHAVMIGVAGVVTVVFAGVAVVLGRRWARSSSNRWWFGSFGILAALLSVAALVVTIANTTTTLNPEPGLLGFFEGSW